MTPALASISNFRMRGISLMLLFVFVSVQTPLHEIMKLPTLVMHYWEHKKENPSLKLVDFIDEHYVHTNTKDGKHSQLPFKDEHHPLMIGLHYTFAIPSEISPSPTQWVQKEYPNSSTSTIWRPATGIWQPPRA